MKFLIKSKIKMDKKEFVKEHKNLIRVLRSKDHKDDLEEADEQEKELEKYTKKKSLKKGYTYQGPMTAADITLASWNEYFREGGTLNQPSWLENDRLKKLRSGFSRLSRYHGKVTN